MTTTALASGFTPEAFNQFLAQRNEPAWLTELRREAWRAFVDLPLPDRKQEEWMRTDIRIFHLDRFGLPSLAEATASDASTPLPSAVLTAGVELGGSHVVVDGRTIESRLEKSLAARGVLFGSLDALVAEHDEKLRPHFQARGINPAHDKFSALAAACWTGGTLLYVPRGVTVELPLHMLSAVRDGGADFGRTLVVLEEGADVTLLAETAGGEKSGLHAGLVELFVGPAARLQYVNLQNWGPGVWHFAHQKGLVDRDGSLQWTIGALGSRLAKVNQHVALVGSGAAAQVNGVMFTEGKQHLSYHTLQHHQAPHCKSDLLYKGALQDQSRVVWRGMVKVDPVAQKTNGYQRNDNLMLSEDARADSIPGLEIQADDVRCTHGSTAGRVDEEQVFYARCRGLTRKEAIRMIVAGFFQQVFDRIRIESVRDSLGEAIGRRIREYD